VLIDSAFAMLCQCILMLCFDVTAADFDRIEFITADAAKQDFLSSGLGVEVPLAGNLHERNRKGPVIIADVEYHAAEMPGISSQALLGASLRGELRGHFLVTRGFAGIDNVVTVRAEDRGKCFRVELCNSLDQSVDGSLSRSEPSAV